MKLLVSILILIASLIVYRRVNSNGERSVTLQVIKYFCRPHEGIPKESIVSKAAWKGPELMQRIPEWRFELSANEIIEIKNGVRMAMGLNKSLNQYVASDMPLPSLQGNISGWKKDLDAKYGYGLVIIRGIPVHEWSQYENELFWWCFGQHLGVPGAQNGRGELLGHIRNELYTNDDKDRKDNEFGDKVTKADIGKIRQYRTNEFIQFHCDIADVVGLVCLSAAGVKGGASRLTSSVSVFNELRKRRPDLVPLLFQPTALDTRGDGGMNWFMLTPSRYYDSVLRTFWHTEYFETAYQYASSPPGPSSQLLELIRSYDEIANNPAFYLETEFLEGDIQLISNHVIIHSRTAFQDSPEQQRHLLRLWLSLESPAVKFPWSKQTNSLDYVSSSEFVGSIAGGAQFVANLVWYVGRQKLNGIYND